ncbi:hypothetical protein BS78_03G133400 [Paspalum vaginatum]|nr:hypothetical protein BS78_03G133400 [Paspalum vaginatum]
MESNSGGGGGGKPATRFGFSWADEVEREERERQEEEEQRRRRGAGTEQQAKADPFGAARPREVVLAEKGVDWRARDRELDLPLRAAPRPPRSRRRAAATAAAGAARDAAGERDGRTPRPRGRRAASSPSAPVSRSALGGSKRKCAGEGPVPSRPVGDQRRKVFGELNLGEGCGSSVRGFASKGCDSGGSEAEGIKSSMPAVADAENRGGSVPAMEVTAAEVGGSAVAQKKKKRKKNKGGKRSGRRSNKTQNPETPLL